MQDWVLVTAPLATTVYFLACPSQFIQFLGWVGAWFN